MFESRGGVFFRVQYLVCRFFHVCLYFFAKHFSARRVLTLFLIDPTCRPKSVTRVHRWCTGHDGRETVSVNDDGLLNCCDGDPARSETVATQQNAAKRSIVGRRTNTAEPYVMIDIFCARNTYCRTLDRYQSVLNYQDVLSGDK